MCSFTSQNSFSPASCLHSSQIVYTNTDDSILQDLGNALFEMKTALVSGSQTEKRELTSFQLRPILQFQFKAQWMESHHHSTWWKCDGKKRVGNQWILRFNSKVVWREKGVGINGGLRREGHSLSERISSELIILLHHQYNPLQTTHRDGR